MRYVFRADASHKMGSGHVMRSSALAEEVIARGFEAVFIGKISELTWVSDRINSLGFNKVLESDADFNPNPITDILILDSYFLDVGTLFIQPKNWLKIVVIADDVTPLYSCDLIVHPGLDAHWLLGSRVPALVGLDYLLMRSSIKKSKIFPTKGIGGARVLVVGGGSDPTQFCLAISEVLAKLEEEFEVTFLSNDKILNVGVHNFRVLPIGPNLDEAVHTADLVLTLAGTTSFELIARGLPTGIAYAVENQLLNYHALEKLGVARQIGQYTETLQWNLDALVIRELITSSELQAKLNRVSENAIDLRGPARILDAIAKLTITK